MKGMGEMILSKEQEEIVHATESKIVVIAAAAAGKTTVLVERIKYLLSLGISPKEIVAITFTNAAGAEIKERVNAPAQLYIGTIHGYANYLLRCIGKETSKIIEDEQFDLLFEKVRENPECIQPVKYLLLDEAQDSSEIQLKFLKMINPENYMYVGDWRQSVYRFNGARPDLLIDESKEPDVTTYYLYENYRNGTKILDYAKGIIRQNGLDYEDDSIPMRGVDGKVLTVELSTPAIVRDIKNRGNYGEWFILCRLNAQVDILCAELAKQGVPYDTFKRKNLTTASLNKKMNENTVKVLTIHTSKGLENKNVVVIGARHRGIEEACVNYVAATRAKDLLVWTYTVKKARRTYDSIKTSNWE